MGIVIADAQTISVICASTVGRSRMHTELPALGHECVSELWTYDLFRASVAE